MASNKIDITNGPSKFDLMIALFDMASDIRELEFVTPSGCCSCSITGVTSHDGSGERWRLEGMCGSVHYKAYFDTQTRRGWIEFVPL